MTLLTHRGQGPGFVYAGQPIHVFAGQDGLPAGFAATELTVPHFAGPIPHAPDEFGEAVYVLSGRSCSCSDDKPTEAVPGSLFVAPRGHRHGKQPVRRAPWCWDLGTAGTAPPSCARS
jgi:hypothetical protein